MLMPTHFKKSFPLVLFQALPLILYMLLIPINQLKASQRLPSQEYENKTQSVCSSRLLNNNEQCRYSDNYQLESAHLELPTELWNLTFFFLEFRQLVKASEVSHDWHSIAGDNLSRRSIFWSNLYPGEIRNISYYLTVRKPEEIALYPSLLKGLVSVDFIGSQIGNDEVEKLARILIGTNIDSLYLVANNIKDEGAIDLGNSIAFTKVHTIFLNVNKIRDKGAIGLGQGLLESKVTNLNLSFNCIKEAGAIGLGQSVAKSNLHILNLENNNIRDAGAMGLIHELAGSSLSTLNLSHNSISNVGAVGIALHPKNWTVM